MNRRDFIRTAGGAAGATAAAAASSGSAVAQEDGGGGGGQPDFDGWLDGIDGGFQDARGSDEVTVQVGAQGNGGAFAFEPAGVWVDTGATVVWEWTGEGGGHNVAAQDGGDFTSETVSSAGHTFEQTFEEGGIVTYQCDPHESLNMRGAVAVGDDVPTSGGGGGGGEVDPEHMGVPIQAHFVGLATILMIIVSTIFTFFLLKYGESPHAKGGN